MVFTSTLFGALRERDSVENKPESLLVGSLVDALLRDASIVMWQAGGGIM